MNLKLFTNLNNFNKNNNAHGEARTLDFWYIRPTL